MNIKPYTKKEFLYELGRAKKEIDHLRAQLDEERSKNGLQHTCEFLRYSMKALVEAGMSRQDAFAFIMNGLKGYLNV